MIYYNIRKDGPYEYDKFALIVFQLYNAVYDEKKLYKNHKAHEQLKYLNSCIETLTSDNSLANMLLLKHTAYIDKR